LTYCVLTGGGFEAEQMAQLDFAAHQTDELLGGVTGIGDIERAGRGRGVPEDLAECRKRLTSPE
jgi:hypothetical protein